MDRSAQLRELSAYLGTALEHHMGGNTSQPLHFNAKFIAMVHVHGVRGFVDQDLEALCTERFQPEAGLIDRQGEDVGRAPVGIEAAAAIVIPG